MPGGTPVGRPWVVMLRDGTVAIDWGVGLFQDAISGDFMRISESRVSHRAQDVDLEWLIRIGRVSDYDAQQVFFLSLPERTTNTLE